MSTTELSFVNIAAYKFVPLDNLDERRLSLRDSCRQIGLRGTILLSSEGINMFLAGTRDAIDEFLGQLRRDPAFVDLEVKESLSDEQPFRRMLVKKKKEIITLAKPEIQPAEKTSKRISARELKQWFDEGRDFAMLDVRNDYEIELGSFDNAIPAGTDHFRQFAEAIKLLPDELREKPLVTFCTGGIRCEKASPLMENAGFKNILQLDGGILKYFEECGGDHFHGECFVFDQRVAVDSKLRETDTEQCYACQHPLTAEDQHRPEYTPPTACPYCYVPPEQALVELLEKRHAAIKSVTTPLPGSVPYDNIRPMNVPERCDGMTTLDFLDSFHPQVGRDEWQSRCEAGRIVFRDRALSANDVVSQGQRVEHHIPDTTEPDVNVDIRILYEDDDIIVVNKPAPLPMHPSGRFNRNTLSNILITVFDPVVPRIVHRLDANTSGVVVLAKRSKVASRIHPQFVAGTVEKIYLAMVQGFPADDKFECDLAIDDAPAKGGGRRLATDAGKASHTSFKVLDRNSDGTTLLEVQPHTGRTNQIRLHLASLGLPLVGEQTYKSDDKLAEQQTISIDDPPLCLHALRISLNHPTNAERISFETPYPSWLQ
ncbi:MAG: sulfurtransferase [Planctomycetales bacterium]|nr:sulfurtransferase [Planctomycetales bacterium]